ncbi:WavE lipopolysaccharide synthesis family protein [Shewanella gelidimarina]|uniref:WavE lipopolysaccharide synthesis family protein n=1 Tax=Shewanella gelidimarina TaxID=56813 RepID=UPI00200FFF9C|nr:WavE lipopolysaccharide synthesis family protein [Shewanella gelidimarina]MCL1056394.1 WavE lipopolysaccharide synthesis family protein [Shewanella gelidimarina]
MKALTFVVQGPYFTETDRNHIASEECFASLRKYYPDATVIFSRSDQVEMPKSILELIDHVVFPEDAGQVKTGYINGVAKFENVNRQILGVQTGLALVESEYCCKVRPDFKFTSNSLDHLLKLSGQRTPRLEGKITLLDIYARTEYFKFMGKSYVDYHLSDFILLGKTADMRLFWEGDLFESTNTQYPHYNNYRTIEQMLGRRFYKHFYPNIEIDAYRDVSFEVGAVSSKRIRDDFNFLSFKELGIEIPRRFKRSYRDRSYFINGNRFGRVVFYFHFMYKWLLKESGLRGAWNKLIGRG